MYIYMEKIINTNCFLCARIIYKYKQKQNMTKKFKLLITSNDSFLLFYYNYFN